MSFNAATLKLMLEKGLTLGDVVELAAANERRVDRTATERKRRQRAKSRRDVTRDPPNDIDILTPEASEASASLPQPWAKPVGVAEQVWKDLLGNRKRKNQNNSPTAWKRFNDDLKRISAETGIPPPQLIEHAAAKGWGGIYDPREGQGNGTTNRTNHGGPRPDPTLALVRAATAAQREDRGDYGEARPALPSRELG